MVTVVLIGITATLGLVALGVGMFVLGIPPPAPPAPKRSRGGHLRTQGRGE